MILHTCTTLAVLASLVQAATLQRRAQPTCRDFLIPVTATSSEMIPADNIPSDLSDPVVLTDYLVSQLSSGLAGILGGVGAVEQSGEFAISARYCAPAADVPERANTIQYLQHAITNTKNYWNGLAYPEGFDGDTYSYIKVASDVSIPLACLSIAFTDTLYCIEWVSNHCNRQPGLRKQYESRSCCSSANGSPDGNRSSNHRDAPQWPSIRPGGRKGIR